MNKFLTTSTGSISSTNSFSVEKLLHTTRSMYWVHTIYRFCLALFEQGSAIVLSDNVDFVQIVHVTLCILLSMLPVPVLTFVLVIVHGTLYGCSTCVKGPCKVLFTTEFCYSRLRCTSIC